MIDLRDRISGYFKRLFCSHPLSKLIGRDYLDYSLLEGAEEAMTVDADGTLRKAPGPMIQIATYFQCTRCGQNFQEPKLTLKDLQRRSYV